MKRTIVSGLITILLFFASWIVLAQIDWVETFDVNSSGNEVEEKLGDLMWSTIRSSEDEIKDAFVLNAIDSILTKITEKNDINKDFIKIHIVHSPEINAFVLPDGHLIIYTGLILHVDNEQQLGGVLCHELAHIELDHVMKKLIKEVGLSVLVTMANGNSNSDIIRESLRAISSSAFDRGFEKDADLKAVDYMIKAEMDPEPFASFLYELADAENNSLAKWISTHPASKERARYVIEYSQESEIVDVRILTPDSWSRIKELLDQ